MLSWPWAISLCVTWLRMSLEKREIFTFRSICILSEIYHRKWLPVYFCIKSEWRSCTRLFINIGQVVCFWKTGETVHYSVGADNASWYLYISSILVVSICYSTVYGHSFSDNNPILLVYHTIVLYVAFYFIWNFIVNYFIYLRKFILDHMVSLYAMGMPTYIILAKRYIN